MRLAIVAVGRLKAGPERDLVERYRTRVDGLARQLGFGALDIVELPEGRGRREDERRAEEAAALLARIGTATLIVLDERGASPTSPDLAEKLGAWRDAGRDVTFVIGGPDGLDAAVRSRAALVLSFGALTLPHQLVRALVAEQLYRALTILSGHPYHRAGSKEA